MKFGSELNDRSVSRWRNYNIDYNGLKRKIKVATTDYPSSVSSGESHTATVSSDESISQGKTHLERRQRKAMKELYLGFKDQIQFVSLFVNTKYGEISRRIMASKNQLSVFVSDDTENDSPAFRRMRSRKFLTLHKEVESISTDLEDLSRFILLQKIAIRKLFKKFLKYSTYAYKQELVDKITAESLNGDPDSFVNLDLSDASLELTLMFDVMDNYYAEVPSAHPSQPKILLGGMLSPNSDAIANGAALSSSPQNSLMSLEFLQLPPAQVEVTSASSSLGIFTSKSTSFDIVAHKKAPVAQTFWVHPDNLQEIRFLLMREFKLISDDTGIVDDDHRTTHGQLKNTESSMSLLAKHKHDTEAWQQPDSIGACSAPPAPPALTEDTFHPDTELVMCWLANYDSPKMSISKAVKHESSDSTKIDVLPCDVPPCIYYSDYQNQQVPLLVAPIGGLRQFTLTTTNPQLMSDMFDSDIGEQQLVKRWQQSGLVGNPKMAQTTFGYCYNQKLAPAAKVKFDRLRFVCLDQSNEKIECYITLDSNVRSEKIAKDTVWSKLWSASDELSSEEFPHSILTIRYESPMKQLLPKVQSLMNSHLVYRVDQLNFSVNNYLVGKYYQEVIPDSTMLEFIVPWFDVLSGKDIRKLPSIQAPPKKDKDPKDPNPGILLNKGEGQLQGDGYWNEFDYGSDYEDGGPGTFYVYEDNETEEPENNTLFGLNLLTPEKVDRIIQFTNSITNRLPWTTERSQQDPEAPLLTDEVPHYSSAHSTNSGSDSDTDFFAKDGRKPQDFRNHALTRQLNHDRILTGLYFSLVLIAYLTDGIGIGIICSVIESSFQDPGSHGNGCIILLLLFGFLCMSIALLLSIASVCLIMCRYVNAPTWHHAVIWVSLFLMTTVYILLLVSLF